MGRDWGEIRPVHGRWSWPYAMMEEGDSFEVSKLLRNPEKLRHMTYVRGNQLGVQFRFEKSSPKTPGNVRITRVSFGAEPSFEHVQYGVARDVIMQCYGIDSDPFRWTGLDKGEVEIVEAKRQGDPPKELFAVKIDPHWLIAVELRPDCIRMERLGDGVTFKAWHEEQVAAILE